MKSIDKIFIQISDEKVVSFSSFCGHSVTEIISGIHTWIEVHIVILKCQILVIFW